MQYNVLLFFSLTDLVSQNRTFVDKMFFVCMGTLTNRNWASSSGTIIPPAEHFVAMKRMVIRLLLACKVQCLEMKYVKYFLYFFRGTLPRNIYIYGIDKQNLVRPYAQMIFMTYNGLFSIRDLLHK